MESHSDRWKQFEERVRSESERIEREQESAFKELSERLSERASAARSSTESVIDEMMAELKERIRARIEREAEGITGAVEEAIAKAVRDQKRALNLWSKTATVLAGWIVLVAALGLGTWYLGAKGAQKWKELRLLETAHETENEGFSLMRKHGVSYQVDERGLWIQVEASVKPSPGADGRTQWILLAR
jgi:hypothetical protein